MVIVQQRVEGEALDGRRRCEFAGVGPSRQIDEDGQQVGPRPPSSVQQEEVFRQAARFVQLAVLQAQSQANSTTRGLSPWRDIMTSNKAS